MHLSSVSGNLSADGSPDLVRKSPERRCTTSLAVALCMMLLASATTVLAGRDDVGSAQAALDSADAGLASVLRDASFASSELDEAVRRYDAATSALQCVIDSIHSANETLRATSEALPGLERDASTLQQRTSDIRAAQTDALSRTLAAEARLANERKAATDAFTQSPAFQQFRSSIERSQQAYDQTVGEAMTDLHADDGFFELEVYLWQAEDDVERLRALPYSPANQQQLAEASQDMMDLRNQLSQVEEQAIRSNAMAESARQNIAAAMDAQRIAMAKFERSRDASPGVADAIAALNTERARGNVITRDLNDSETAAAAVQRDLVRASANANAARDTVAHADADIWRLRNEVSSAASDIDAAQFKRDRASSLIAIASSQRDSAASQLRDAIESTDRHRRDEDETRRHETADRERRERDEHERHDREAKEQHDREEASRERRAQDEQQARNDADKRQHERDESRRRAVEDDQAQQASARQKADDDAKRKAQEERTHEERKASADHDREARRQQERQARADDERKSRESAARDREQQAARDREQQAKRDREAQARRDDDARQRENAKKRDDDKNASSSGSSDSTDRGSRYKRR